MSFFNPEDAIASIGEAVRHTIEEQGRGPMLDVVQEMPRAEDFEPRDTNVRKDFLCKWHCTCSKKVKAVSLEECMEGEDSGMYTVFGPVVDVTERVAGACARKHSTMFVDTLITASPEFFMCRSKREAKQNKNGRGGRTV